MRSLENIAKNVHALQSERSILVELKNEQSAILRAARPEDAGYILEMHGRLSQVSLYYRYFYAYKPTLDDVRRISQRDVNSGAAIVAILQDGLGTIIGLGNYIIDPQKRDLAELAIVVEDRFQRQGLGRALLQQLRMRAAAQGIQAFRATILPSNKRMRRLIERSGSPYESKYNWEQGVLEVILPLAVSNHRENLATVGRLPGLRMANPNY